MKIDIGNGQCIKVQQGVGDVKQGLLQGDLSRISAYGGKLVGVHAGSKSRTVGRHNSQFGSAASSFFHSPKPCR